MKRLRITVEPHAEESQKEFVRENLGLYSIAMTGDEEYYTVVVFLRGAHDEILGGVLGEIWGQWLFVSHVWLAAPLRRSGYGSKLLATAERYAVQKGCRNAWLTTASFQARPFYEKFGYKLFATLDEFPPGHKLYFLKKQLAIGNSPAIAKRRKRKPLTQ
ncbi:MAG: GNAT family N-acetyltransferase [Candidatus Binatia bacterium]